MKVTVETTVAELMKMFPEGCSIGPGTPEEPGVVSKILYATSHFVGVARNYPVLDGNKGYLVVDMDC